MNIHRIILAVLVAATIAVGTTTVTVYADGTALATVMDSETRATFDQLTPGGRRIIEDVWPQIKSQAPRQFWEAEVESIVQAIHTHEVVNELGTGLTPRGPGDDTDDSGAVAGSAAAPGARRATTVARMVTRTNMYVGYTSAVTGVYVLNEGLSAGVTVFGVHGRGNSNMCTDCLSVYASVPVPPNRPGYYSALGVHNAANPQGFATSGDSLKITN